MEPFGGSMCDDIDEKIAHTLSMHLLNMSMQYQIWINALFGHIERLFSRCGNNVIPRTQNLGKVACSGGFSLDKRIRKVSEFHISDRLSFGNFDFFNPCIITLLALIMFDGFPCSFIQGLSYGSF